MSARSHPRAVGAPGRLLPGSLFPTSCAVPRRVLIGCYEVPGYGGASTASYGLVEALRASGVTATFVNLVDEQDADFFRLVFGPAYGNPRGLDGVRNCVLCAPLYDPHPELTLLIDELDPDVVIGVGYIAALLLKRAAPRRTTIYLTSGCQQLKDAITRGRAADYLEIRREIDRGIRRPHVTCAQEREAVEIADLVVVHSDMTRRLCEYYFPHYAGKIFGDVLWFARWIHADAADRAHLGRPFAERDIDALFVASSWARPEKNFGYLKKIVAALDGARVHVAGECEEPVPGAVHHGLVTDREALFALMGRARSVVCPSSFDTAPGILFEASALGCNVVASENCGNAMICDDRLLVRRYRPDAFAGRVRASLEQKYADNIGRFLDERPYRRFLETLDVL
jgi:glycosyltransferase involved in cell wall biosynthesis